VRVAIVAVAALIYWSENTPLNAIEFVALRFSCNCIGPTKASANIRPPAIKDRAEIALEAPRQQAGEGAAKLPDATKTNSPKREVDAVAAANLTNVPVAIRENSFIAQLMPVQWDREQVGRLAVVLASTLLLTSFLMIVHIALVGRKSVTFDPGVTTGRELQSSPQVEAEACRELMMQITTELMRASGAVNSLQEVPALQSALHRELNSIRQSSGFAPQSAGNAAEKKDWHRIKLQLIMSLRETRRISEIAAAARVSFSSLPAALQDVTTRLEAYAFLGVNATSSEAVLKKTVDALRLCWHPDFATDEEDRRQREMRIKQINVAWDLISRKRMSAC